MPKVVVVEKGKTGAVDIQVPGIDIQTLALHQCCCSMKPVLPKLKGRAPVALFLVMCDPSMNEL